MAKVTSSFSKPLIKNMGEAWLYGGAFTGILIFYSAPYLDDIFITLLPAILGLVVAIFFHQTTGKHYNIIAVCGILICTIGGYGLATLWSAHGFAQVIPTFALGIILSRFYILLRYPFFVNFNKFVSQIFHDSTNSLLLVAHVIRNKEILQILHWIVFHGSWGAVAVGILVFLNQFKEAYFSDQLDPSNYYWLSIFVITSCSLFWMDTRASSQSQQQ